MSIIFFEENVQQIQREMTNQLFYQDSPQLITFYTQLRMGSFSTNAHYHWELNQLKLELNVAQQMNAMIGGMDIYFPKLERALSVRQRAISLNAAAYADIQNIYATFRETGFRLTRMDDVFFIPCYYPIGGTSAESGHILIALRLDEGKIQEILSSFNTFSGKNALLYHYASDTCITSLGSVQLQPQELQALLTSHAKTDTQRQIAIDGVRYLAMCAYSETLDCSFVQLIPESQVSSVPNILLISTLVFFVAMLTVVMLILQSFHKYVNRPVQSLIAAFDKAGQGEFAARVAPQKSQEFAALANGFNQMTTKLEELIDTNYRQTITLQQAQLKTLQAQINPHFIYNTLDNIRYLIPADPQRAQQLIGRFIGILRYSINNTKHNVTVKDDLKYLQDYLVIQSTRFGANFSYEIDIDDACMEFIIPKLLLQPLLENSIKYGFQKKPHIHIRVRGWLGEDALYFTVEDNGGGVDETMLEQLRDILRSDEVNIEHNGLQNINRRIWLGYGGDSGLTIDSTEGEGFTVKLKLRLGGM